MARVIDTNVIMSAIQTASNNLLPEDHEDDCPVKVGASSTCVWPVSVCVPDDFEIPDGL